MNLHPDRQTLIWGLFREQRVNRVLMYKSWLDRNAFKQTQSQMVQHVLGATKNICVIFSQIYTWISVRKIIKKLWEVKKGYF